MARHGTRRSRPAELEPGTQRVISVRMDYVPPGTANAWGVLEDAEAGYVSRYALGRDYHKLMRNRLQKLAERIRAEVGDFGYRAYVDSAPVLEKALARNAGLGWIGKHTVLINRRAGSYFFLGELYTDLPLPVDAPASAHCGSCRRCIDICPTQAIVGAVPAGCAALHFLPHDRTERQHPRGAARSRWATASSAATTASWSARGTSSPSTPSEPDFAPRHSLDGAKLVELFAWSEDEFLKRTEGMAIRRTGHEGWLRNIAVALGNAPPSAAARARA